MKHLALLLLLAAGCATDTKAPLDPQPPADGVQLATDTYHLAPSQEVYMCYQFYSPDDAVGITRAETISGPGIHHLALFQVVPGSEEPDAAHECNIAIKLSWLPVFVSGTGSKELTMPDGVGFVIKPHTQYVLQLHLQNTTDNAMDIRAGINLTYNHKPDALQPAGIFAAGKMQITIPPNSTDFQLKESCMVGRDRNIIAVFPHMHKLATEMDVTLTPSGGTTSMFYQVKPFSFGNQPVESKLVTLHGTDKLEVTCHWNNPQSTAVTYGESSDNEMCYFVTFYYPYDHLDGCID